MNAEDTRLERYAEVLVRLGVNVQPGQPLAIINPPPEAAPLVHAVVRCAYQIGAHIPAVLWHDEALTRLRAQFGKTSAWQDYPTWNVQAMLDIAREGGAHLAINGRSPDLLAGLDPDAVKTIQTTQIKHMRPVNELIVNTSINWCTAAVPTVGWARKVFPELSDQQAVEHLWEAIFAACRITDADPLAAWERHIAQLQHRADILNTKAYRTLHYRAPGTDLRVGLPAGHRWITGRVIAQNGIACIPNIPTEEVFTLPHRHQVDGVVTATKPLVYRGSLIEGMRLRFEAGRVVEAHAAQGQESLLHLLDSDEGARHLGEIALVPNDTPVSRSGLLFYNMLYDENSSCHLALGRAYKISLSGGMEMDEAAFAAAGGNSSLIHSDFMIGSSALDVDGTTSSGDHEPVLRAGEWAF